MGAPEKGAKLSLHHRWSFTGGPGQFCGFAASTQPKSGGISA
jgi:hypothetical protein